MMAKLASVPLANADNLKYRVRKDSRQSTGDNDSGY